MAKYLSRAEEKEVSRLIAQYNRRAYQISHQKRFAGVATPQKLDIKAEISSIENKRDLNRLVNRMQNAFKPENLRVVTNRQGVRATAGVIRQVRLDIQAANRRLERVYKEKASKPVYVAGQYQGTMAQANPEMLQEYRPLKFDWQGTPSQRQLEAKAKAAQREGTRRGETERQERYQANYIQSVSNAFPAQLAEDIIQVLDKLTPAQFEELLGAYPEIDFEFIYGLEEAASKASSILGILNAYTANL